VSAARDILRRLSALGARVECRGERVVLRTGCRPVPRELIEAARQVKTELSKVLNTAEDAQSIRSEHLRCATGENPRVSAVSVEDAHLSAFDERLGAQRSNMLTEDVHLSMFDEPKDFRGSPPHVGSKMFNSSHVSIFGPGERLWRAPKDAPTWDEGEAKRAAIVEHSGRIPCAWAEGFARLDPDRPPADAPARRWVRFIDDIGLFLDSPFCAVAAALGWTALDLFGADRDRPFARIDQKGLLWLLNGKKLVALTEDTATMQTQTGARQILRRKPAEPGQVLPWESPSIRMP
jgi:hypothetical protein